MRAWVSDEGYIVPYSRGLGPDGVHIFDEFDEALSLRQDEYLHLLATEGAAILDRFRALLDDQTQA